MNRKGTGNEALLDSLERTWGWVALGISVAYTALTFGIAAMLYVGGNTLALTTDFADALILVPGLSLVLTIGISCIYLGWFTSYAMRSWVWISADLYYALISASIFMLYDSVEFNLPLTLLAVLTLAGIVTSIILTFHTFVAQQQG